MRLRGPKKSLNRVEAARILMMRQLIVEPAFAKDSNGRDDFLSCCPGGRIEMKAWNST